MKVRRMSRRRKRGGSESKRNRISKSKSLPILPAGNVEAEMQQRIHAKLVAMSSEQRDKLKKSLSTKLVTMAPGQTMTQKQANDASEGILKYLEGEEDDLVILFKNNPQMKVIVGETVATPIFAIVDGLVGEIPAAGGVIDGVAELTEQGGEIAAQAEALHSELQQQKELLKAAEGQASGPSLPPALTSTPPTRPPPPPPPPPANEGAPVAPAKTRSPGREKTRKRKKRKKKGGRRRTRRRRRKVPLSIIFGNKLSKKERMKKWKTLKQQKSRRRDHRTRRRKRRSGRKRSRRGGSFWKTWIKPDTCNSATDCPTDYPYCHIGRRRGMINFGLLSGQLGQCVS